MKKRLILLLAVWGILGQKENAAAEPETIRVLLMDTGYQSYYHGEAVVSAAGETYAYTPDSPELSDGPVILEGGGQGICVTSISRQGQAPVYEGTLEIHAGDGGLLLINELPLETYLEGVVPSEMPSRYEAEALKAQAICARTYAWKQMQEEALSDYGADVDDSVNFQVYQNVPPQPETSAAVQETAGKVLTHDGELIEAYYFSTSAGATSTDEVWGAEETAAYLKSVPCSFDGEEPWSAWEVTLPWDMLEERASGLPGCGGTLNSLAVMKKSEGGAAVELCVYTEAGVGILTTEYDIREFLAPTGLTVTEKDGTETEGGGLLPSAYFELTVLPEEALKISGGGYGHGVGMSQSAANAMAEEGYTCEEILQYFFRDVAVETVW